MPGGAIATKALLVRAPVSPYGDLFASRRDRREGTFASVRQLERRVQLLPNTNNLRFRHGNDRGPDFDISRGLCAQINCSLEGLVEFRATVWVTGRIFGDGADIDVTAANYFRPTGGHRQQMSIAKRHIAGGYSVALKICRSYCDSSVS